MKRLVLPTLLLALAPSVIFAQDRGVTTVGVDVLRTKFVEDNGDTTLSGQRLWLQWLFFKDRAGIELQLTTPMSNTLSWSPGGGTTNTYDVSLGHQTALMIVSTIEYGPLSLDLLGGFSYAELLFSDLYRTNASGVTVYDGSYPDKGRLHRGVDFGVRAGVSIAGNLELNAAGVLRGIGENQGTSNLSLGLAYRF